MNVASVVSFVWDTKLDFPSDINWIYNLHHLNGQGYYLKSRYPEIRLIQCLPDSNKCLNKDLLIVSREWHDSLPYSMREGTQGGALGLG